MPDEIMRPAHYTRYGVEVIEITRYLPFCLGNVVKYVLRAPYKNGWQDCDKALIYLGWCGEQPLVAAYPDAQTVVKNLLLYEAQLLRDGSSVALLQAQILRKCLDAIEDGQYLRMRPGIEASHRLLKEGSIPQGAMFA